MKVVHAQELIPCSDGSFADPTIGCVTAPSNVVNAETSLPEIILQIATTLMTVVAGVAVVTLIIGGIMYATAMGNDGKIKKSKCLIFWSVTGLAIAILARSVAQFILYSIV